MNAKVSAAIAEAEEAIAIAEFKRDFPPQAIHALEQHEALLAERLTLEQVLALQDEMQDILDVWLIGLGEEEAERWLARLFAQAPEEWRLWRDLRRANRERADATVAAHAERAKCRVVARKEEKQ
jgi:hypothetical protein